MNSIDNNNITKIINSELEGRVRRSRAATFYTQTKVKST